MTATHDRVSEVRAEWTYTRKEWAAYARWVRRHAFLERATWITTLCAAAAGCVAHVRGHGGWVVVGWGVAGLLVSVVPLALAWWLTAEQQAEVLRAPRVFRFGPDGIEFCGNHVQLGDEGWRLEWATVHANPLGLLELNFVRDVWDEQTTWKLWVPVPARRVAEALKLAVSVSLAGQKGSSGSPS